jgi:hypothetical protein
MLTPIVSNLLWADPVPGDFLTPEPPAERFERLCDTRYVTLDLPRGKSYGVVINGRPATRQLLVRWHGPALVTPHTAAFDLEEVHPLGELRDAVTYVDAAGHERRGLVVCCDGDTVHLEVWSSGQPLPRRTEVHISDVIEFRPLLAEVGARS